MMKWWSWVILAMGTSTTQRLREHPEPHGQAELDRFVQDLGSSKNMSNVSGGEVASPGLTNDLPTDAVSCPAASLQTKGG